MGGVAKVADVEVFITRPSVLIVDDDREFLESASDYFSTIGYDVDTALTPEEAAQILKENREGKYQLVATDIDFGSMSDTGGDQFVLQNRSLFGDATPVVITGAWLAPHRRKGLQDAGIYLLEKSPGLTAKLGEIAQKAKQELANTIATIVSKETAPRIEQLLGKHVSMKVSSDVQSRPTSLLSNLFSETLKQMLIDWLKARPDPDKPALCYDNRVYSANELAEEISSETEVGLMHIQLLLSEFQYFLGANQDDS